MTVGTLNRYTVYTHLLVCHAFKLEVLFKVNFWGFIDVPPISRFQFLPDQTVDCFLFVRPLTSVLYGKYLQDTELITIKKILIQKFNKQNTLYS